jgi:hypothetical protein
MAIWDNVKKKSFILSFNISPDTSELDDSIKDKLTNIFNCLITKTGTEYVSPSGTDLDDESSIQSRKSQNEFDFKWFNTHTTITVNDDTIIIKKQKVDEKTNIQTPKGEPVTISRSAIGLIKIKRKFTPLTLLSSMGIGFFLGFLLIGGFITVIIFTIIGLVISFPKVLYIYRKDGTTFKAVISTEEGNESEYERLINVIFQGGMGGANPNKNVVVNVTPPVMAPQVNTNEITAPKITSSENIKLSAEKVILSLADKMPVLTLRKIITNTDLEMEEVENAMKKLIAKGIAKESVDTSGKSTYTFE